MDQRMGLEGYEESVSLSASNVGLNLTTNELYDELRAEQRLLQARTKAIKTWFGDLATRGPTMEEFDRGNEQSDFTEKRTELIIDLREWLGHVFHTMAQNIDTKTMTKTKAVATALRAMKGALRKTKAFREEAEMDEEDRKNEEWLETDRNDNWEDTMRKLVEEEERKSEGLKGRLRSATSKFFGGNTPLKGRPILASTSETEKTEKR